jgi:cell division protease FtsH
LKGIAVAKELLRGFVGQACGETFFQHDRQTVRDREFYLNQIAMLMAGLAAEDIFFGAATDGAGAGQGSDLQRAADLATVFEARLGMGAGMSYFAVSTSEELETLRRTNPVISLRVEQLLASEHDRAWEIIERKRSLIERIAAAVSDKGFVEGEEVLAMIAKHDAEPKKGRA